LQHIRKTLPTKLTGLKNSVRGLHGARVPVVEPRAPTRGAGGMPRVALFGGAELLVKNNWSFMVFTTTWGGRQFPMSGPDWTALV